jgi:hypothetical protein
VCSDKVAALAQSLLCEPGRLPVADEIKQEIEHLGLEREERVRPPQFAARRIEHELLEMKRHAHPRSSPGNQAALSVK